MKKSYKVEKYIAENDKWLDYGSMPAEDVKLVVKGYKKLNSEEKLLKMVSTDEIAGMYTRKGTMNFYTVTEA